MIIEMIVIGGLGAVVLQQHRRIKHLEEVVANQEPWTPETPAVTDLEVRNIAEDVAAKAVDTHVQNYHRR